MHNRALVLMTALVPTKGHRDLIHFAEEVIYRYSSLFFSCVDVIVSTRSFEPLNGRERVSALKDAFFNVNKVKIYEHMDDLAPQSPADFQGKEEEFWNYWKNAIHQVTGNEYDLVVASEMYGYKLAEVLGAKFMPYDLNRFINPTKGTDVRNNIVSNFSDILPEFQHNLVTVGTIFGAESCWKTSITKHLRETRSDQCHTLPEWARPYLESLDNPTVTPELMEDIMYGQYAMQMNAKYNMHDKPFIFQDTDLLSTIGYYRIMGMEIPQKIIGYFLNSKSDIYFLSKSNVPFVVDPLRYGGDKRESDDQFWIDLLEEFGCKYCILDQGSSFDRAMSALATARSFAHEKYAPIRNFVRD